MTLIITEYDSKLLILITTDTDITRHIFSLYRTVLTEIFRYRNSAGWVYTSGNHYKILDHNKARKNFILGEPSAY